MSKMPQTSPTTTSPHRRSRSLRSKLVIILLIVALTPLSAAALLNDKSARQSAIRDANENLLNSANSVAAQLDDFIQAGLDAARYQAHLPVVLAYFNLPADQRLNSAEEEALLDFMLTASYEDPVYITSIAVLDAQGVTLMDTSAAEIGANSANRAYFQRAIATATPYASAVEYDHLTGKPSLYFAAPIQNTNDELLGILRIRYDALILQDIIAQATGRAGKNSFAMLLDENHIRLAHGAEKTNLYKSLTPLDAERVAELQGQRRLPSGAPADLATNLTELEAGLEQQANQPAFSANTHADNPGQVALAKLTMQNWVVAFAQPQAVIFAPVNAQTFNNALTSLLIAVGIAFFGLIFAEALAESVIRLTNSNAHAATPAPAKSTAVESSSPASQPVIAALRQPKPPAPNEVESVILGESVEAQPRRPRQPEDDRLEVAIQRLGSVLRAARVNADGDQTKQDRTR